MGAYPTSPRNEFFQWCQDHADVFESNATAIGLTNSQAASFKLAVGDADAAVSEQSKAQETAKAATNNANLKFTTLRRSAAQMVRSIKTFAENTGNGNVYVLAQVPPPAAPGTTPPPGKPFDVSVQLDTNSGAPVLKWKARNPAGTAGTSYIVRRKLPTESAFAFVGVTGTKGFTDNTFIAGPDSVQYTIQGQRSDRAGSASDAFTINFGRAPGLNNGSNENNPASNDGTNYKITGTSTSKLAA